MKYLTRLQWYIFSFLSITFLSAASGFELTMATWNILNQKFYENFSKPPKSGLSPEKRRELFEQNFSEYLQDIDIIGLQEVQLLTEQSSLFKDRTDFIEAIHAPMYHAEGPSKDSSELVVLYNKKHTLLHAGEVYLGHQRKYAQIIELEPQGKQDTVVVFVNVHIKGDMQHNMEKMALPQLALIRDALKPILAKYEKLLKKVFVCIVGDFNIDASFGKNYRNIIVDFMKNPPQLKGLRRLFNPFKKSDTDYPCTSQSQATNLCEGIDYMLYGANFPVQVIETTIIPKPEDIPTAVMSHTSKDNEPGRWFASDHAILKVKFLLGPVKTFGGYNRNVPPIQT